MLKKIKNQGKLFNIIHLSNFPFLAEASSLPQVVQAETAFKSIKISNMFNSKQDTSFSSK